MNFEYTVTLGGLIQSGMLLCTIIAFFYGINGKVDLLKYDVSHLKKSNEALTEAFKQLGQILIKVAVQDERIQQIENNLNELRHGRGLIK